MEYRQAAESDFEELVALRIRAMKPSLEKIGRFDSERARERFRESFLPGNTTVVTEGREFIGFYMLSQGEGVLFLNHLYIDPLRQRKGVGRILIERVKNIALEKGLGIQLEALKESPSNDFYLSQGFIKIGESEFDNIYYWMKR